LSTKAVRETGDLVTKRHHADPLTERKDGINDVIKRVNLKNKEK